MNVAIAGGHGQIARLLGGLLSGAGAEVTGLIRNAEHAVDLEAAGVRPVVCDLEHAPAAELSAAVASAGVVVFAAGAGPGSSAERKLTMDRDGAVALLRAAPSARYVMVSAVGAESPPDDDSVFAVYLRAKAQADAAVSAAAGSWTILRPGRLTDAPGTGRVTLRTDPYRGEITRADTAAVLAELILTGAGERTILYAAAGETTIADAVAGHRPA